MSAGVDSPAISNRNTEALKEEEAEAVGEDCWAPSVRRQGALVPLQSWSLSHKPGVQLVVLNF